MKITKSVLDKKVAIDTNRRRAEVSLITELFLEEVKQALVEHGEVQLDGVGTLRVTTTVARGGTLIPRQGQIRLPALKEAQLRVNFRKSEPLRTALRKCGRFKQEKDNGKVRSG